MSEQRHIIKRQVIELTIQGPAEAQSFQDELSRIYRQRIIPLIDQRCSELSAPDRLYRIDLIELDLGKLAMHSLEEDFVARVDALLVRQLRAQINAQDGAVAQAGSGPAAQSQLELFAVFMRAGSLPWWADFSNPALLAENLEYLLREAPGPLTRLLQDLVREPDARQRMINQYRNEQLSVLCALLAPEYGAALKRDFGLLLEGLQVEDPIRFRRSLWNTSLQIAAAPGFDSLEAFYRAIFSRISAEIGAGLFASVQAALHRSGAVTASPQLAQVVAELVGVSSQPQAEVGSTLATRLAHLQADGGIMSETWSQMLGSLAQLPALFQAELLAALEALPGNTSAQVSARRILPVFERQTLPVSGELDKQISAMLEALRKVADSSVTSQSDVAQTHHLKTRAHEKKSSQVDELPITNAGLVILWPFLVNFFTRVDLLDTHRQFKEVAACQRAVGLLQVIANQEAQPPEYLLPVNKVLCGLEPASVFDFGPPPLERETQECEDLLEAVIAQAPILHNMSADGFRGSFLLRPGLLSVRDGAWLLRVERQTYDIVLERFPWSWEWVRLPWMESPIRVEW